MKRFSFGLCEWSLSERGKDFCKMAASQKLDCIQLGVGEEIFKGQGLASQKIVEEYQWSAKEYELDVVSLSPQFVDKYSFTMPKSEQEEQMVVDIVNKTIDLLPEFGCRSFLLPVLGQNGVVDGPSFHKAVSYIREFSEKAAAYGAVTCLEINLGLNKLYDLLDAVDSPYVKIFFDSQNLYALDGTSMSRYFTELQSQKLVGGIHLKDGMGSTLSGSLLGEGSSGFYRTAKAIKDSDYTGALIIESVYENPTVCHLGSPAELLAKDVATLRSIF